MKRLMRLRQNQHLRDMSSSVDFGLPHLIQPLFVVEGLKDEEDIPGLGATKRQSLEKTLKQIESDLEVGVRQFILFQVPAQKKESQFQHNFSSDVISQIKKRFSSHLQLWVDTCLCSLTTHGHCGVFRKDDKNTGKFDMEATHVELSSLALSYVQAGADGISPSDMMDGRVRAIRNKLDQSGYDLTPIMSYSTKFASNFYGPFRMAADSAPNSQVLSDRKSYQIDVRNRNDAIQSSLRCAEEGADLLMIKPGMTSIDLVSPITDKTGLPVGAYQVSGEYASLNLLAEKGLIDFEKALIETWNVFRRAGCQFIITYGARHAKKLGLR